MSSQGLTRGLLVAGVALLGAWALAQTPAQEPALTRTAQDAGLQWGPCPPFMPAGCGLAVLHGDPAKPNVDVFLKLPPNTTIPEHWHTSAERMVMAVSSLSGTPMSQLAGVVKLPLELVFQLVVTA